MRSKNKFILTALCGLTGTIALALYFTAPFTWMPLPPPSATPAEVFRFGMKYHTAILADTWLQQTGTILSVIFALSLVHLSGRSQSLTGRLTLFACAVITSLSLAEGTFALGALLAGDNGSIQSAYTCFELTNVFIHIFLLAPSLFLMMGLSLKGTKLLPKFFAEAAIIIGILFQSLGAISLFYDKFLIAVIAVLNLQNVWTIIVSIYLFFLPRASTPGPQTDGRLR